MTTPQGPLSGGAWNQVGQVVGVQHLGQAIDALVRQMTTVNASLGRLASTTMGRANATMTNLGYGPTGARGTPSAFGLFQGLTVGQADAHRQQASMLSNAHADAFQQMQQQMQRQQLVWDRQRTMGQNALSRTGRRALTSEQRVSTQQQLDINADHFASQMQRSRSAFDTRVLTLNQQATQATQGRSRAALGTGLSVAGAAAGAIWSGVSSYYSGGMEAQAGMYGRRMSMMDNVSGPGVTSGMRAQLFGRQAFRSGAQNWASSDSDLFGGLTAISEQTAVPYRAQMQRQAAAAAFVTPGMGIQGAASAQAELGTARAFYASQVMGLTPSRTAGGGRASLNDMAMSIANRVNQGGFSKLSDRALVDELSQGGSLSTSLQTYGQAAGLSPQTLEAMRNQLEMSHRLTTPGAGGAKGLSQKAAQDLVEQAAQGGKAGAAAYKTMQAHGLDTGTSYQDAQNLLAGKQRSGHLADSADYLDAAKSAANTLADIYGLLEPVLKPLAGLKGALAGGGPAGLLSGGTGALVGGLVGGPVGAVAGGALGWAGKKLLSIGGGADNPPHPRQNTKASSAGSGPAGASASAAISWARGQLGKPYGYGANGPDAWDCSSLTQAAWKAGGVSLPRTSQEQSKVGVEVPLGDAAPGDLAFFGSPGTATHVGLVTGPDTVLVAPHTGDVIKYQKLSANPSWKFARRVAGSAGGAVTPDLGGGTPASAKSRKSQTAGGSWTSGGGAGGALGGSEVAALAAALANGGGGNAWSGGAGDTQTQSQTAGASALSPGGGDAGTFDFGAINGKAGTIPAPPGSVKAAILQGMAASGVSGGEWARGLMTIAFRESTYNPKAENHWDSNQRLYGGTFGMMQTIKPTFEEFRARSLADDPLDGAASVAASVGYIKHRYGGIKNVQQADADRTPLGYAVGAWDVPTDQVAKIHAGEAILTKAQATTLRQALMDGGHSPQAQAGAGGQVHLNFQSGSVVVQMPSATADGARSAAKSFVDYVAADSRIKTLMGGW